MAVLGVWSFTLEVPRLSDGIQFYQEAGLDPTVVGDTASFACAGQSHESIVLRGGAPSKKLHHITLRADDLPATADAAKTNGGQIIEPPSGYEADGLWVADPHGMRIHLVERPADAAASEGPMFEINAPGRTIRKGRSAMRAGHSYGKVRPQRLGHILLFTPDVLASVAFMTEGLGMGLADRAQDVIAFCCARKNSDHHVVAFAKSGQIGFHHGSFQVSDPDEVGRGGRALLASAGRGDWGFGRHTIGSNFFHYIQDPWGSWFEYYSDMDFIEDYAMWRPTNYGMEDSLANWGPAVPKDFVYNYELNNDFAGSGG